MSRETSGRQGAVRKTGGKLEKVVSEKQWKKRYFKKQGVADSFCCTVESNRTLQSNHTPIKINNKKRSGSMIRK